MDWYEDEYDYFRHEDEENEDGNRNVEEVHGRIVRFQVNLRWQLRDTTDPFRISLTEFQRLYRIPQHEVWDLIRILSPVMPIRTISRQIPVPIKVLVALSFYGSGSYQRTNGRISDLNVSQSTASNIIEGVTEALNHPQVLLRFIKFPRTHEERMIVMQRNEELGMPRVLGFIDGTYVQIVPPKLADSRDAYHCRKGFTALNVQIVCDAQLRILDVNAQYPGSCNDPFIYRYSGMRDEMVTAYRESRCWLLGDSAYPFEPWLHVPLLHAEPGTPEDVYTHLHCHCRNAIERCNGCLKERWRCLLSDRVLHYSPEKAGRIVNACAVLHNFCIERNVELPPQRRNGGQGDGGGHAGEDAFEDEEGEEEDMDLPLRQGRQLALQERQFLINVAVRARLR